MKFGFRQRVAEAFRFWFIQALVGFVSIIFRLRAFREKTHAVDQERSGVIDQIKKSSGWKKFEIFNEYAGRYASPERQQCLNELRRRTQMLQQETEDLQAIRTQAGENTLELIERYHQYIEYHPDSQFAYLYLGGALQKAKNWDASVAVYREAERLARDNSVFCSFARLDIGRVLQEKGDLEAACAQYRRMIETRSAENHIIVQFAYLYLGDILNEQGKRKEARSAWKQAGKWDKLMVDMAKERLKANP